MIWAAATLTIIFAVAANLIIWGSVLYRSRRPMPAAPKYKPRHVATERIHAGGRYLAVQPRHDAPPLTEQTIITTRPGRPDWHTAPIPVARDERPYPRAYDERHCAVPSAHGRTDPYYCTLPAHHYPSPVNDDAATLAMYRGDWGVRPQLEAERKAAS